MQDELALKQVEVLLDLHTKRLQNDIKQLREELSRAKEELHKEIREVRRQDPPVSSQNQFGYAAPPQWGQPQSPQQWAQQAPPQQWSQQAPPQWQQPAQPNKWAPPPEKPASTQPIDRNGVAPADVSIERFFNFSGGAKSR